ncbi:glycosyltransferase family 4 protein [Cohnella sp. GbtcB17]|uniref:glycosyltransferase family 4 protein n=1 Tax=Cohnella sp. GbtcB17 TaxID=2824762 RepID=UPI001C305DDA|nr:glycosyltransferase family 4 protein [Cohnella sp. GbtcB17]
MNILTTGMGWIDHSPGGLNRYFADYSHAMRDRGHDLRAFVTAGGDLASAPAYIAEVLREKGSFGTWDRMRAFRQAVGMQSRHWKPQVYNPHFALYAALIGRGQLPRDIPIVTHFHGPWASESKVEDRSGASAKHIKYRLKKSLESLTYQRSDKFVVLSGYFASVLSEEYGIGRDRIHIVPGAVDTERFKPAVDREGVRKELGIAENDRVLFCVRRLVRRMGVDRLIRAFAAIAPERPEAVLVIAGDGAIRAELQELAAGLGLRDRVKFAGRVSNEQLVRWYQAADVAVVPTVTLEGFGLVTVEALACGTPVLGTPNGGTKEILGGFDGRLLFEDDSPEAMADLLGRVLARETPLPDRADCRKHVLERYTWLRVAEQVEDLFLQAIHERGRKAAQ